MLAAACKSRGGKPKNGHKQKIIIKSYYRGHTGTENNQMDPIALGSPWQLKRNVWIYMVFLVYYDTQYPQNSLWDRMQGVSKSSGKLPSEMWNTGKWGEKRREGRVHVDDTEAVLKGAVTFSKFSLFPSQNASLCIKKLKLQKKSLKTKVSPLISNDIRSNRKALCSAWSLGE